MTQHETLLTMFRENGNWLSLAEILKTSLAAEYRARISELRHKGFTIECCKGKRPSENVYRLVETQPNLLEVA